MTRERLSHLSHDVLLDIADRIGISHEDENGPEDLIEMILEAMDEDKLEKELSNSLAMRIKEKKYEIIQDEELTCQDCGNYPVPDKYNETSIHCLLRDPEWAFAYWDICEADQKMLESYRERLELVIRVFEFSPSSDYPEQAQNFFDIPVQLQDRSWYINLPHTGKSYCIELLVPRGKHKTRFCISNIITSPIDRVLEVAKGNETIDPKNDLVLLSGLHQFDKTIDKKGIPQRIISLMDAEYLKLLG